MTTSGSCSVSIEDIDVSEQGAHESGHPRAHVLCRQACKVSVNIKMTTLNLLNSGGSTIEAGGATGPPLLKT